MKRFRCKVSHAGSNPILFLPDRAADPSVPYGWTPVEADDAEYEAKFVKIAVNKMRKRGEESNVLPELLKKWFGPDTVKPGAPGNMWSFSRKERSSNCPRQTCARKDSNSGADTPAPRSRDT